MNENHVEQDVLSALKEQAGRGQLTVFLGAAAGVGKTYAMLEVSRERLAEGVDVVVGLVETHGRSETGALLEGLPTVPPRVMEYRGKKFNEMDLDALLSRCPEIALVDDLAHTNIPGSRHARRYQDVEELLAAGVSVYTTLNIQHIETLNDVVSQITGITVRETVPDRVLENAFQIQLIDIPPDELIQRLKEGKVYVPDQAAEAMRKFFRPGNINALREMAMRFTARRVDRQVESYMRVHDISGPWPAGERVMVCVGPSPFSAQLIRMAKRMAVGLQADWIAVHVETSGRFQVGEAEKDDLAKNLRLAEELGAEIINITGDDIAEEILYLARKRNVSQIIIGKPFHTKLWEFIHGSVVDKVIRHSHGISIHVIPGNPKLINHLRPEPARFSQVFSMKPYLFTALMIVLLTFLAAPLKSILGLVNIALFYLLPILFSAVRWGTVPAVVAALLAVITFDFFLVPPVESFTVADLRYVMTFIIFLVVALFTSSLSTRLRQQINISRSRESRISALYSLSRDIAAVSDLGKVAESICNKVAETVEGRVILLLPNKNSRLEVFASSEPDENNFLNDNEMTVAVWTFNHGQKAGRGTDTLGSSESLYLPLLAEQDILGVLTVQANDPDIYFQPEQLRLMEAFSSLAAMAVARAQLAEQAKASQMLEESERLRTVLFNSLSHDFRTPLASILGAVTGLLESDNVYTPHARRELLKNIQMGAMRMNRFVNNLLDMARLESGLLHLKKEWCDIMDIVGVAAARLDESLGSRTLKIDIQPDLPLVRADFILIEQVIVNLIDNALKYSERGSEIKISARRNGRNVVVSVADRGQKIPPEDMEKIFDKFYRLKSPRLVSGTGLGLAICKGFIEAHRGKIRAEDSPQGGVVITFTLPLEEELYGLFPDIKERE